MRGFGRWHGRYFETREAAEKRLEAVRLRHPDAVIVTETIKP